jgi:ectoine hydroxylase-related dioxygenase (phytanoyl-CoA dioxygenase family)
VEGALRPDMDVDFDRWHDRHFMAREGIAPFRAVSYSREVGRAVQRFNERDVAVRHWADMIAVKPREGTTSRSGATPFHQDYPNRQFDRVGNVTFWVALEDMPAERGTCRFRSGSQQLGPLGRDFGPGTGLDVHDTYPWLAERYPLSEPRDMKAGDATAHSQLVLHTAPANATDVPRWTYISIYFPADTLWTGTPFHGQGDVTLEIDQPFDHLNFPIVYP